MKQTSEALPVISRQKEKSKVGGREELDLEKRKKTEGRGRITLEVATVEPLL